jgi:hypothetical protein
MDRFICVISAAAVFGSTAAAALQLPVSPAARAPKTNARAVARPNTEGIGRLLPGSRGNLFPTIRGNALNSANGALPSSVVRLRDARFGRIVDTQVTDNAGVFTFTTVDPGSYIVEVMGNDQTVLAASQIISVNAGETVTAIVKLPFRVPPYAGVFGHTTSSAVAVTSEAIASGILATTVAGAPVSPVTP